MIRFDSDYTEGAHPKVLELLNKTNSEQTATYGEDYLCEQARKLIKKLCANNRAAVHFLVGGTQTNATLISAALRPHQGVICADIGHIACHETGAIEATGHKIITLPSSDGKITALQIRNIFDSHYTDSNHEHMVQPGMVYISNPTETGSIYSKSELTAISEVCRKCELILYLDGARLGYGLTADCNDLTLPDIAKLCDAFYIGGTKQGALFGEALVITKDSLKKDFRYYIKQNGAMLAKGRLLGLQFLALLSDNTYFDIAKNANRLAYKIKEALTAMGFEFDNDSPTNQQFPIFPDKLLGMLGGRYIFSLIKRIDENHCCVRICTSWATTEEAVDTLLSDIRTVNNK